MTGEIEDTDVGFPGPEHHIAERELPMKIAMGALAVLATIGGVVQIPGVTDSLHNFLEPTFADSRATRTLEPSTTLTVVGLILGAVISAAGIFIALPAVGRADPERRRALQARFAALHTLLRQQVVLRRGDRPRHRAARRVARPLRLHHVRARLRQRRAGRRHQRARRARLGRPCARVQTGYLRYYAALLLIGVTSLGAYFLVSA